jgi:hypothetical protein
MSASAHARIREYMQAGIHGNPHACMRVCGQWEGPLARAFLGAGRALCAVEQTQHRGDRGPVPARAVEVDLASEHCPSCATVEAGQHQRHLRRDIGLRQLVA